MASSGGLTRRRGAGGGGAIAGDDENDIERISSPTPKNASSYESRAPETSYTGGENGHKIAFDPRDISENAERSKQPKLTLMEEVLLMGLKDKQVHMIWQLRTRTTLTLGRARVTYHSGTTTFHMHCEGVLSSSWRSGVE